MLLLAFGYTGSGYISAVALYNVARGTSGQADWLGFTSPRQEYTQLVRTTPIRKKLFSAHTNIT